ncbi:hypothetical protein BY996DRAFT_6562195 [Phakopsora pachyrhizi]|nr:hypothetical protein BY996DRAFT_6562195 [Phakopsora pachyrhizi]
MGIRATEELEVGEEIRFENGGSSGACADEDLEQKANDQQYARQRRDNQQALIENWTMTEKQQSQNFERGGLFVLDGWLDYERSCQERDQHIDGEKEVGLVTKWRCLEEEINCSCWLYQDESYYNSYQDEVERSHGSVLEESVSLKRSSVCDWKETYERYEHTRPNLIEWPRPNLHQAHPIKSQNKQAALK